MGPELRWHVQDRDEERFGMSRQRFYNLAVVQLYGPLAFTVLVSSRLRFWCLALAIRNHTGNALRAVVAVAQQRRTCTAA